MCHLWQCHHYKCFNLTALHPLCAFMFCLGFALREYGAFNYLYTLTNLIIYILSVVFIYVAPPLLELANYHVLGRIFYYVPYNAPLNPARVLAIFTALSLLVETLNALGASLRANVKATTTTQDLGRILTIAALALQVLVIVIFFVIAGIYHRRCARGGVLVRAVSGPLATMYTSGALISIRCIYRLVEQTGTTTKAAAGADLMNLSPIVRYEWFFYVFEATLMLLNSALWSVRHPRRYLPESNLVYLARDGITELTRKAPEKTEKTILQKILSLHGIHLDNSKRESRPFWELDDVADDNRPNSMVPLHSGSAHAHEGVQ
ncbi:hypothetical protein BX600DRAFT_466829 [Xylariales sp. PMI_506]|nr:hypothetical protein BX600DRAFT_466829 [Xylariales sp. PMI_506]